MRTSLFIQTMRNTYTASGVSSSNSPFVSYVLRLQNPKLACMVKCWAHSGWPHPLSLLPPYCVNMQMCYDTRVMVTFQDNVWCNETIMMQWINQLWKPACSEETLLVHRAQTTDSMKSKLEECKTEFVFVPSEQPVWCSLWMLFSMLHTRQQWKDKLHFIFRRISVQMLFKVATIRRATSCPSAADMPFFEKFD